MDMSVAADLSAPVGLRPTFREPERIAAWGFSAALIAAAIYVAIHLVGDIQTAGESLSALTFAILGAALALALGFEFVNGFHDTANAVATVIYTRSLSPTVAVVWSGIWNFLGAAATAGAVAYAIIALLPVELILQVGSAAGYAMVFAILISAIVWNVGTWYLGIPNSSSHCLIGSILGVGLANQLMAQVGVATSGVDWSQAEKVGKSLFMSPLIGFTAAAILLLAIKILARNPKLHKAPTTNDPPPWWIRGVLISTCTAVSFAHGGNDGQKGMGLLMLILIGAAPAAFALNRGMPDRDVAAIVRSIEDVAVVAEGRAGAPPSIEAARAQLGAALQAKSMDSPESAGALAVLSRKIGADLSAAGTLKALPREDARQLRSDLYVVGEASKILSKKGAGLSEADKSALTTAASQTLAATRFIPDWVKFAVAIALGLGTMVGWKRIVITIGERIGRMHMTYAQGAAAETIAATTILTAQHFGLPVSTTHVLSSGVAGTMAANGSGLQWRTVGRIASAWLLTLPAVICLSGILYYAFLSLVS